MIIASMHFNGSTKKRPKRVTAPKSPQKKYGFASVDHEATHYFKLMGKQYRSACGKVEFRPPNLGMNSTLISQAQGFLEEYPWCEDCRKKWNVTLLDALEVLKNAGGFIIRRELDATTDPVL